MLGNSQTSDFKFKGPFNHDNSSTFNPILQADWNRVKPKLGKLKSEYVWAKKEKKSESGALFYQTCLLFSH